MDQMEDLLIDHFKSVICASKALLHSPCIKVTELSNQHSQLCVIDQIKLQGLLYFSQFDTLFCKPYVGDVSVCQQLS